MADPNTLESSHTRLGPARRQPYLDGLTRPRTRAALLLLVGLATLAAATPAAPPATAARCDVQAPVALRPQVVSGGTSEGHVVVALRYTLLRELSASVSLGLELPAGITRTQPLLEWTQVSSSPGSGVTTFVLDFQPRSSVLELYFRAASVDGGASGPPLPDQMLGGATIRVGPSGQIVEQVPGSLKPEAAGSHTLSTAGHSSAHHPEAKVLEMPGVMK